MALMILHNSFDADDVVMEAFDWIFKHRATVFSTPQKGDDEYLRTVVSNAVRRAAHNYVRRLQTMREHHVPLEDYDDVLGQKAAGLEIAIEVDEIWGMLYALPNKYRKVLQYYAYGCSTDQIARALRTTPNNVRKIRFRARQELRKNMSCSSNKRVV